MKRKLHTIVFVCFITTTMYPIEDVHQPSEFQADEPSWDLFGGQEIPVSVQPRAQTIDFSNPPRPSRLEILMRRIGIPIFLRYIQFYNWVRRCVYWVRTRVTRAFSPLKRGRYESQQH